MFKPEFEDTQFICVVCNDEYSRMPFGGYCDNSLECCSTAELFDVTKGEIVSLW